MVAVLGPRVMVSLGCSSVKSPGTAAAISPGTVAGGEAVMTTSPVGCESSTSTTAGVAALADVASVPPSQGCKD